MAEFLKLMESWGGYQPVNDSQVDESAVAALVDLIANKGRMPSHRHEYLMREVITTSDFPNLFGVAIDRQVLARYRAAGTDWQSYFKISRLPNFNTHRRHKVQGQTDILPQVVEKGEYLVSPEAEAYYTIALKKYGRQFDISWEALVNDSMGAFSDIPQRFADAAINSMHRAATATYASATGPNALLYGAPITDIDGQAVTNLGALPLTIANLETTLELMAAQTDVWGNPIIVRGVHLVVPPALEFTARQILTSTVKMWIDQAGGGTPTPYPMTNVVQQLGIQLHVDPWLPIVDVGSYPGTTWYVFGEPSLGAAVEFAYLSGYEDPEICMKNSDKVTVGGGSLSPFSGDFATDNIFYRVRHVFGTTQLDPRFTYAQVATS